MNIVLQIVAFVVLAALLVRAWANYRYVCRQYDALMAENERLERLLSNFPDLKRRQLRDFLG